MLTGYASGLLLGLSLAGPPGPVNALIARQAATRGVAAGIRSGLPAPIVDTAYMLLVLLGVQRIPLGLAKPWLAGAGALVMGYLAILIARPGSGTKELAGPWAVWLVTLTNPFQYAWWLSAGALFIAQNGAAGVLGFLTAIFGWVGLFSLLMAKGAARWDWFSPLVTVLSADCLAAFAVLMPFQATL